MKNANQDGRLSARPILNRHFLFGLLAAFLAACPALPAIAQDDNLELNPDSVPTSTVIATVPVGGSPGIIVVNKKDTFVYVLTAGNVISEIDASTNAVVATWSAGTNAAGLAITPDGKQLYVTNITSPGGVTILDASTGAVLNTIPIVTGEPLFPQISPNGKFAYVPSIASTGYVTVIDTATQKIKKTISVGTTAYDVAFNRSGSLAYVADPENASLVVIDTANLKVTHTVAIGGLDEFVVVNPVTNDVFVPYLTVLTSPIAFNAIAVIRGNKVIKNLTTPANNFIGSLGFTPNGKYAYVPNSYFNGAASNYVYLMDTKTYETVGTQIQVGTAPGIVVVAHNGEYAYVSNFQSDSISVIKISPKQ
jgi:YVTN family beta-propeller protein